MVLLLIIAFLLKCLEVRKRRDALIVIYVGYFVAATGFLFNQGIVATLAGIVAIYLLTSCLFILHTKKDTVFFPPQCAQAGIAIVASGTPDVVGVIGIAAHRSALVGAPCRSSSAVTGVSGLHGARRF